MNLRKNPKFLPIDEDDTIAETTMTNSPNWNRFSKDRNGRVLEIRSAAGRGLRHKFALEFRREEAISHCFTQDKKNNKNNVESLERRQKQQK